MTMMTKTELWIQGRGDCELKLSGK